jgi:hypothetical protein
VILTDLGATLSRAIVLISRGWIKLITLIIFCLCKGTFDQSDNERHKLNSTKYILDYSENIATFKERHSRKSMILKITTINSILRIPDLFFFNLNSTREVTLNVRNTLFTIYILLSSAQASSQA